MDTKRILADLRAERSLIDRAIAALEAINGTGIRATTPKRRARSTATSANPDTRRLRARRSINAAGRKRISEAAKKMWAKRKKGSLPSGRRPMSAATKRKLSQLAKARWAERKRNAT